MRSLESIPLTIIGAPFRLSYTYPTLIYLLFLSRKSFACLPNSKKSRLVFRHPIDGKFDCPVATIPPRLILFNSYQNDSNRILMCIKLHLALHISILQSWPSESRILESPIIPFTNLWSVVSSVLNLSDTDTDFLDFFCRKSYESSQKPKKSKCLICCQIDSLFDKHFRRFLPLAPSLILLIVVKNTTLEYLSQQNQTDFIMW